MQYNDNLVIDMGMHNGDDTAYYLHRGFSVVAIDANPVMVEQARRCFREQLEEGRLTLLDVGIAESFKEAKFYISDKDSEESSFSEQGAIRKGSTVQTIQVRCVPFSSVLSEFGIPYYAKIDIEGNDHFCLDALESTSLPRYLSLEVSARGDEDIRRLAELGYDQFMFIRQKDLQPMTPRDLRQRIAYRRLAAQLGIMDKVRRVWRRARPPASPLPDGDWQFRFGSSGTFGPDLAGRWVAADEALAAWKLLRATANGIEWFDIEWFDIHATKQ